MRIHHWLAWVLEEDIQEGQNHSDHSEAVEEDLSGHLLQGEVRLLEEQKPPTTRGHSGSANAQGRPKQSISPTTLETASSLLSKTRRTSCPASARSTWWATRSTQGQTHPSTSWMRRTQLIDLPSALPMTSTGGSDSLK